MEIWGDPFFTEKTPKGSTDAACGAEERGIGLLSPHSLEGTQFCAPHGVGWKGFWLRGNEMVLHRHGAGLGGGFMELLFPPGQAQGWR